MVNDKDFMIDTWSESIILLSLNEFIYLFASYIKILDKLLGFRDIYFVFVASHIFVSCL